MKKSLQKSDELGERPKAMRKPKILLVGEGPDDIGREQHPGGAAVGFLQSALFGAGEPVQVDELAFTVAGVCTWATLSIPQGRKRRLSFEDILTIDAEGQRVLAALVIARTKELDAVFVLKDCEQEGRFELQTRLRNSRIAFEKNDPETPRPALVVATPSRVHETWLLADPSAVSSVFGQEGIYQFSKSPEDRPHSDALKSHIDRHSKRCRLKSHEARRQLSFRASPNKLSSRCPKCYPNFLMDVETELKPLIP